MGPEDIKELSFELEVLILITNSISKDIAIHDRQIL